MLPVSAETITVDPQRAGTLIALLRSRFPDRSWSQVRQIIRGRRVLVNAVLELDEQRRLVAGDRVDLTAGPQLAPPLDADVVLRYWDRDVVVVEKPARMITLRHRSQRHWPSRRKAMQPALHECIPRLLTPKLRHQRGGGLVRIYSVHRIDRDTSGLLVFARNDKAKEHLIQQFTNRDVVRLYHAIIDGSTRAATITSTLIRDRGDGLRGSLRPDTPGEPNPDNGKLAITHVTPRLQFDGYSEVECRLETGRTHQIRIHLAEAGHPVCGDHKYRGPFGGTQRADNSRAPRLALHAAELGFHQPTTGELLHFRAEWPNDMQRFIRKLSGKEPPQGRNSKLQV